MMSLRAPSASSDRVPDMRATQALDLGFNPNQPRDGDGKWTNSGYTPGINHKELLPPDEDLGRRGIQVTTTHITNYYNAKAIKRDGFDVLHGGGFGDLLGRGGYGSLKTPSGQRTTNAALRRDGSRTVTLEMTLKKPLVIHELDVGGYPSPEKIATQFLGASEDQWFDIQGSAQEGLAMRQAALDKGYDSIVWRDPDPTDTYLGDQVVVFNSSQVKVTSIAEFTVDVSEPVRLLGLFEFVEMLYSRASLTAAADNPVKTGSMIAWFPSDEDRGALALDREGAEDESALHVTLGYTGKAADLDEKTRKHILDTVHDLTRGVTEFEVRDQGTGIFELDAEKNDGKDRCVVALMDSPGLQKLRDGLMEELRPGLISTEHGFTAHCTLTYLDADEEIDPALMQRGERIMKAGAITVCFGPEQYVYPFAPKKEENPLAALALALLAAEIEEFSFNPNQPRDSAGRWSDSGGPFNGMSAEAFVAANPRGADEAVFEWQGRIVKSLPRDLQSEILFRTRERYPPCEYIKNGADRWCDVNGLPRPPDNIGDTPCDIEEADAVAEYFENTPDQSGDPRVQAAYDDFKKQSEAQWAFMTSPLSEGGLGIRVTFTDDVDPYPTARAQNDDLNINRHVYLQRGLGGAHEATITGPEYDRFRAVHDVFGHAGVGGGFDRHGEYQAWLMHASMYEGAGRAAMSTEYHAVNSALWTGAPGTPGTGKSMLLPNKWADPPWDRG